MSQLMKLIEKNQIEMSLKILNIRMNLRYLILLGFYYNENYTVKVLFIVQENEYNFRISVLF